MKLQAFNLNLFYITFYLKMFLYVPIVTHSSKEQIRINYVFKYLRIACSKVHK